MCGGTLEDFERNVEQDYYLLEQLTKLYLNKVYIDNKEQDYSSM
jgi:hypothetical protein